MKFLMFDRKYLKLRFHSNRWFPFNCKHRKFILPLLLWFECQIVVYSKHAPYSLTEPSKISMIDHKLKRNLPAIKICTLVNRWYCLIDLNLVLSWNIITILPKFLFLEWLPCCCIILNQYFDCVFVDIYYTKLVRCHQDKDAFIR